MDMGMKEASCRPKEVLKRFKQWGLKVNREVRLVQTVQMLMYYNDMMVRRNFMTLTPLYTSWTNCKQQAILGFAASCPQMGHCPTPHKGEITRLLDVESPGRVQVRLLPGGPGTGLCGGYGE